MRRAIGFLCILFLWAVQASAQKRYFIYLQAEPEQAYFVKMQDKSHASSAAGYLVLSRLQDSSYTFIVSFPQNKWPDQQFVVDIKGNDHGFLLKNFPDKGWGLFDLQSMSVQMGSPVGKAVEAVTTEPKDVSAFTAVLSKAANDPSLTQRTVTPPKPEPQAVSSEPAVVKETAAPPAVVKSEPLLTAVPVIIPVADTKKPEANTETVLQEKPAATSTVAVPVSKDTTGIAKILADSTAATAALKDTGSKMAATVPPAAAPVITADSKVEEVLAADAVYKRSVITRRSESSTSDGFGLTYTDEYEGKKDTIRIIIPNPKSSYAEKVAPAGAAVIPAAENQPAKNDSSVKSAMDTNLSTSTPADASAPTGTAAVVAAGETKPASPKTSCASVATDADFMKLRKKMAAETDDDDMVELARKTFKGKCFTTEQVKNLGSLFLNDAGKYKFFDAAYPYIADPAGFPSLEAELKDAYYKSRFKAMLR